MSFYPAFSTIQEKVNPTSSSLSTFISDGCNLIFDIRFRPIQNPFINFVLSSLILSYFSNNLF